MKRKSETHLEYHFPFVLWYITMYDVRFLSDVATHSELVSITLHLTEDHRSTLTAAVNLQDGADSRRTVVVAATDCKMLQNTNTKMIQVLIFRLICFS